MEQQKANRDRNPVRTWNSSKIHWYWGKVDDLQRFDPDMFVNALFEKGEEN